MIKFDENGFALDSGLVLVSITDTENIYLGEEEQFVSVGCGLAQYAYLDKPPMQQQKGYVIVRLNNEWQQFEDHRGEKHYSITEKKEIEITELGELPDDLAPMAPPTQFHEWQESTQSWYLSSEGAYAMVEYERANLPDITQKQLRLTLIKHGILPDQVESKIAAIPDDENNTRLIAQTEWQYAQSFERMSNNLNFIAKDLLGLDDLQIDSMWQEALKI